MRPTHSIDLPPSHVERSVVPSDGSSVTPKIGQGYDQAPTTAQKSALQSFDTDGWEDRGKRQVHRDLTEVPMFQRDRSECQVDPVNPL